jgi:transcriptional regulator of acetoin/glycerol metabolism
MQRTPIDTRLRPLLESFASDLTDLITRAALDAVRRGLDEPATPKRADRQLTLKLAEVELTPALRKRASSTPLSLDAYERMAIQRALAEGEGNALAAAKLLGISKSAIYRRMDALGISAAERGLATTDDPLVMAGEPLSVQAYEKAAIVRAMAESGADKLAAAKLLGVGKSTLYRLAKKHGL